MISGRRELCHFCLMVVRTVPRSRIIIDTMMVLIFTAEEHPPLECARGDMGHLAFDSKRR